MKHLIELFLVALLHFFYRLCNNSRLSVVLFYIIAADSVE